MSEFIPHSNQATPTSSGIVRKPRGASVAPTENAIGVSKVAALCVVGFVFLSVSRVHAQFGILVQLRLPFLLAGASAVLLALDTRSWRPKEFLSHWTTRSVGLIFAIAVLGVPFSIYPGRSFAFLTESYWKTILLCLMVWAVARTSAGTTLMARSFFVGCVTAAGHAVLIGRTDHVGRLSGASTYDPNDLALIANLALPLAIWIALDTKKAWERILALLTVPLLLYVIVLSGSRGGFLGLAAIAVGMFAFIGMRVPKRLRRTATTAVIVAACSFPLLPGEYVERIETIFNPSEDYNVQSHTGRLQVWKRGMGYAVKRPILGVGIDNFPTAEGHLSERARNRSAGEGLLWQAPHSSVVQLTAELGFIAGATFIVLLLRSTWMMVTWHVRAKKSGAPSPEMRSHLPPLMGLSLASFCVSGSFLSFAYYDVLYFLLAITAATLMREARPNVRAVQKATRRNHSRQP